MFLSADGKDATLSSLD